VNNEEFYVPLTPRLQVKVKHIKKFHGFGEDEDFIRKVLPPLFQQKLQNLKYLSDKG
jgi:hypothetical protein